MKDMLQIRQLTKRYGGLLATDQLSLSLAAGELHAIIGPNGAGKTTLIAQLSGEVAPDSGAIEFDGHDITALLPAQRALRGLARSYQITSVFPEFSVLENVTLAMQARTAVTALVFGRPCSRSLRWWSRPCAPLHKQVCRSAAAPRSRSWRMASGANSSWPWCWWPSPSCCCLTSPWLA